MNLNLLEEHLKGLSHFFKSVEFSDDYLVAIVRGFRMPPGWNRSEVDVLIEIPDDYPFAVPGVDGRIYLPLGLLFRGQKPSDYHDEQLSRPGFAWWCYERISWKSEEDDLIRLMEMLRTDLSDPL
jgi:hypothetical protein